MSDPAVKEFEVIVVSGIHLVERSSVPIPQLEMNMVVRLADGVAAAEHCLEGIQLMVLPEGSRRLPEIGNKVTARYYENFYRDHKTHGESRLCYHD